LIGPGLRDKLRDVIARVDGTPLGSGGAARVPVRLQTMAPRRGGGGTTIRLGQFTGAWYNEPGQTGSDNLKLVKLYVQPSNASTPNDWVPELDANGEEVVAVTMNLFSYIPTRSGNDSYMWCAVLPISSVDGEYWTGAYDNVEGQDVPVMRPYTTLWLLLAAEC
jgi:hypothetical protein